MKNITNTQKIILAFAVLMASFAKNSNATTYTVVNNLTVGAGSFTNAIASANSIAGKDTILFASNFIVTNQPAQIITDSLVIDATTQPSFPTAYVSLIGNGVESFGLDLASNVEVYGLKLSNYTVAPILINTNKTVKVGAANKGNILASSLVGLYGFNSSNFTIAGNKFSIAEDGSTLLAAGNYSLYMRGCASGTIGANSFSTGGNLIAQSIVGIDLDSCSGITVIGNKIGCNAAGTSSLGTLAQTGIYVTNGSTNISMGTSASGNQIVNMSARAILMDNSSNGNTIAGNLIGTNAAAAAGIPNNYGIEMFGLENTLIGGNTLSDKNIISGNVGSGIYIYGNSRKNNIYNNYIGVGSNGTTAIGNGICGIELNDLTNTVDSTNIGAAGKGNIIANSTSIGLNVNGSNVTKNSFMRNEFSCNGGGAIVLTAGANGAKVSPVITSANTCQILGTSAANDIIEIYKNHSCVGVQGKVFVGTCTANGSGVWAYSLGGYSAADDLTAIAIATNRNTSAFNAKFNATTCVLPSGSFPASQCGYLVQTLSGIVKANAVVGASNYEFTFYPVGSSMPYATKITTSAQINFGSVTPTLQWGTQYDLRVRPIIAGNPGGYSAICTTGLLPDPSVISNIGTTTIRPQYAQPNNVALANTVRCFPVTQGQAYEFKLIDNVTVTTQTVVANGVNLTLSAVSPALVVGRSYTVSVRAKVYGFWGNFGATAIINITSAMRQNYVANLDEKIVENNVVSVYPNPFTNQIFINNVVTKNNTIMIFDVCGKLVLSEKIGASNSVINTENLPIGIFFIKSDIPNFESKKIVKY